MPRNTPDVQFLPLYTAHPEFNLKWLDIRTASSKRKEWPIILSRAHRTGGLHNASSLGWRHVRYQCLRSSFSTIICHTSTTTIAFAFILHSTPVRLEVNGSFECLPRCGCLLLPCQRCKFLVWGKEHILWPLPFTFRFFRRTFPFFLHIPYILFRPLYSRSSRDLKYTSFSLALSPFCHHTSLEIKGSPGH